MSRDDDERWPEAFEEAVRRQASRPPTTPSHEAARRIGAALGPRRRLRPWLVPAAAAAAVALLLTLATLLPREPASMPSLAADPPESNAEPLPENVVLWWIDPETPVYFVVSPPSEQGGPS